MICRRCALRLKSLRPIQLAGKQHLNTLANPRPAPGPDHEGPPAATSTSAAQPFTTPLTPAPKGKEPAALREPRSSVPAGTRLDGLNYLKNKQTPLALEDHEYPEWLWSLLDEAKTAGKGTVATEGDAYGNLLSLRESAVTNDRSQI
jgi:large subunit ribosomal protein L54